MGNKLKNPRKVPPSIESDQRERWQREQRLKNRKAKKGQKHE